MRRRAELSHGIPQRGERGIGNGHVQQLLLLFPLFVSMTIIITIAGVIFVIIARGNRRTTKNTGQQTNPLVQPLMAPSPMIHVLQCRIPFRLEFSHRLQPLLQRPHLALQLPLCLPRRGDDGLGMRQPLGRDGLHPFPRHLLVGCLQNHAPTLICFGFLVRVRAIIIIIGNIISVVPCTAADPNLEAAPPVAQPVQARPDRHLSVQLDASPGLDVVGPDEVVQQRLRSQHEEPPLVRRDGRPEFGQISRQGRVPGELGGRLLILILLRLLLLLALWVQIHHSLP